MPVDTQGVVTTDVSCKKCSYNLRGLPIVGRCPECGTAVGLSVCGDFLQFADPEWVLKLRKGINFIIGGVVVLIVGAVIGVILQSSAGPLSRIVLSLIAALMMLGGGWLLTEPDPSGLGEAEYGTARQIIRIALCVGLVNNLLSIVPSFVTLPPVGTTCLTILIGLAGLVGLVGQFAQLNYLSKLAVRIPDAKLSGRARFLMWAIGISYGLIIVIGILIAIIRFFGAGATFLMIPLGLLAIPTGLCLIVFGIMYLLMLEKFGKRFKEQAALARSTWAANIEASPTPTMAI